MINYILENISIHKYKQFLYSSLFYSTLIKTYKKTNKLIKLTYYFVYVFKERRNLR